MNDKKKITIIGVTGVTMLIAAIAAPLAIKNSGGFRLKANPRQTTVTFTSVDSYGYDEEELIKSSEVACNFTLSGSFEDASGETQNIESYSNYTFVYIYSAEDVTFNTDDCLFVIDKAKDQYGYISFPIHDEFATLNLEKSVIDLYHGAIDENHYYQSKFYYNDGESYYDSNYSIVTAFFDDYSYYGEKIYVKQVKLVFDCLA